MNLETMVERVRKVSGFTMPELYSDTALKALLNEVYLDVCGSQDWPFLYRAVSLSVDTVSVPLDPPLRTLSSVTLAEHGGLQSLTLDELLSRDQDHEGRPEFYARVGNDELQFWPVPDQAYPAVLRGFAEVEPLSLDTDAPVFEAEFHPVLVYETSARVLAEYGDFDRVESFRGQAADGLSRMRVRYLSSKDRGLIQMGGRARDRRFRWRA